MILCYHKVAPTATTHWWVSADEFNRQMADLQAYDVVHLADYDPANPDHAVITFDGVYANVARFALPILRKWGYPFELFVIGDRIGEDNEFDQHVEPPARFASLDDLDRLVDGGGRVQWHTRTHTDLAALDADALAHELTPPDELRERYGDPHLRWFAFPHGRDAARLKPAVSERFDGATGMVEDTSETDRFLLPRVEVTEGWSGSRSTVSVIIANYNYGRYFPEAIDSVFRQTGRVDELLVIDDASTDGSQDILRRYEDRARIVFNERNLGIVENFRKAVSLTSTDYVVFLGADNRYRSDFVERCKAALDANPDAAVAYTDTAIFGPRSHLFARQVEAEPTAADDVYVCRYPDPTPERLAALHESNIIHGSSMYRRADYDRAGGYRTAERAEDHDLFARMVRDGRTAVRVAQPVLEYRQHSPDQANTVLSAQLEADHHRRRAEYAAGEADRWHAEAQRAWREQRQCSEALAQAKDLYGAAQGDLAEARDEMARLGGEISELRQQLAWAHEKIDRIESGRWWQLRTTLLRVTGRGG